MLAKSALLAGIHYIIYTSQRPESRPEPLSEVDTEC